MRVGTKSVIWGVHCFWWHWLTVALAFCRVHKRLPCLWELVGIFFHDWGYWNCDSIDGPEGVQHPYFGAEIAGRIVDCVSKQRGWDVRYFCLFHSSSFAKLHGAKVSSLYLPDKCSILMEPKWWYLFRARLSGELREFVSRESVKQGKVMTESQWYAQYRAGVQQKFDASFKKK